ncbi:single-stranded DNA-binding protein [Staphylococcus condimenti]|uniref:Single-stranded DNA-binding protein n=1 Tax=Staphylococcus condimenti TaxID=70255 RepID=A0A143PDW9_9STAP|nr:MULTISPECIES: single-stranded DNA-binding protein [Staphylococcus]AMY06646.1 single-stranded DNA-binding protein [Staphylococcus condimenti]APR60527.1 single-stranded DNA-binding protein [Staphylococcus condimenti]MDK8645838.1 single-stranded DNA-binding protein [Staphylococcus condimenti]OFP03513.1 single-stranded DNA-binding protein [Staphylococcus sp. HMSC065E08]PNZ61556.1 single-stranded DNA-binding protein [Staphylococcus condimenti]
MLNKIVIVGRLTRNPQLAEKEGSEIASFSVATERNYNYQGQTQQAVDYIFCKAYGKIAINIAKYTKKGSLVGITGHMRSYKYEKDKQTHFMTELVVETIKFISNPNSNESSSSNQPTITDDFEGSPALQDHQLLSVTTDPQNQ